MIILKKSKSLLSFSIIFFFFLTLLLKISSYTVSSEILSCDGDDPKTGVCALILRGNDGNGVEKIQIKKECEDDEICGSSGLSGNIDQLQCLKIKKGRKIGKSCKYDADCITNKCSGEKCIGLNENEVCEPDLTQCGPGLSCSQVNKKCIKLAEEGESCNLSDVNCNFGLECNTFDNKCYKIGSLEEGRDCGIAEVLCKSGVSYNGRCVTILTDGTCERGTFGYVCKGLQLQGATYADDEYCTAYIGDVNMKENYVCRSNLLKQKMWEKYLKEFEDIDLEDYKDDKKYLIDVGTLKYTFGKKKLKKYFLFSRRADMFKARKLIDEDGDWMKKKKCEGKFLFASLGGNNAGKLKLSYLLLSLIGIAILI